MTCLLCKYLEGAADDSTHMHTARYATADNREGVCLCTDLQLHGKFVPHHRAGRFAHEWCLNQIKVYPRNISVSDVFFKKPPDVFTILYIYIYIYLLPNFVHWINDIKNEI